MSNFKILALDIGHLLDIGIWILEIYKYIIHFPHKKTTPERRSKVVPCSAY